MSSQGSVPFEARNSIWKHLLILPGCALLGLEGLSSLDPYPADRSELFYAWLAVVLSVIGGVTAIRRLIDRSIVLRIDERGLRWQHLSHQTIPWSALAISEPRRFGLFYWLGVSIDQAEQLGLKPLTQAFAPLNKKLDGYPYALSAIGTDRSFADLHRAVVHYSQDGTSV